MENRAVQEWELRTAEVQVKPFLARIRDGALSQALSAYFTSWMELRRGEQRLAQQERNNPRATLEQQKVNLARSLTQGDAERERLRQRLGFAGFPDDLQFKAALAVLVGGFLSCLVFVWVLGLASEIAELTIDVATNLRLTRKAVESLSVAPQGEAVPRSERTG